MAGHFTIYDKTTGEIVSSWCCAPERVEGVFLAQTGGSDAYGRIDGVQADGTRQFVELATGMVTDKQQLDLTIAHGSVSGVPQGAEIRRLPARELLGVMDASGVLELAADHPEIVTIRVTHPRFVTTEIEVPCG